MTDVYQFSEFNENKATGKSALSGQATEIPESQESI